MANVPEQMANTVSQVVEKHPTESYLTQHQRTPAERRRRDQTQIVREGVGQEERGGGEGEEAGMEGEAGGAVSDAKDRSQLILIDGEMRRHGSAETTIFPLPLSTPLPDIGRAG